MNDQQNNSSAVKKFVFAEEPRRGLEIHDALGMTRERENFLQREFRAELIRSEGDVLRTVNKIAELCTHQNEFSYLCILAGYGQAIQDQQSRGLPQFIAEVLGSGNEKCNCDNCKRRRGEIK